MYRFKRWFHGRSICVFLIASLFVLPGLVRSPLYAQETDPVKLFQVCSACHLIGKGKLIGPDLYGVNERHSQEWLIRFIRNSQEMVQAGDPAAVKLWEDHNKIPMPPNDYTDEQIIILLDYIRNYDPAQAEQAAAAAAEKPEEGADLEADKEDFFGETNHVTRDYGTSFLISLALLLLALFDLFVTKFVKARFVHIIIILISASVMVEITVVEAENLGRQPGYEPDQPILFSHKIHAGDNRIDCKYCHTTVTESKHAGIPPVTLCMNCHNVVRKGRYSGTAEIEKIYQSLESGKPVEWIRVHNLPDHTYFNHAQHIGAGKLECADCHGDVPKMHRIRQVQQLSMGWCINCHRTREVQFLDNGFYQTYEKLHEELKSGQRLRVTVDDVGGTECAKCHY